MPTLNWIGKDAVVRHHKELPFRLLEQVPELSCGAGQGAGSGDLIVQAADGMGARAMHDGTHTPCALDP